MRCYTDMSWEPGLTEELTNIRFTRLEIPANCMAAWLVSKGHLKLDWPEHEQTRFVIKGAQIRL